MSEKLLPCPFCGGEARTFEYDGANQATCGGKHIDCAGTDVVAPVAMWNRRTPAPEGEAACVIAFREGRREPEFISWNKMPVGEHRLYAALRPTDTGRKA
jgi:hypothetical protein